MRTDLTQWRWGIMAAVAIALLAIAPQLWFVINRGNNWHGANAISHTDEVAYSAYVSSLISGRPRRNDPYTACQDTLSSNAPESLFSIQMVPAYVVAGPARLFGLDASAAFIVAPVLCAIASVFALFWLVSMVTGDRRFGATAVLVVLGLGTFLAGQGMIRYLLTLPFLIPLWIAETFQSPSVFQLPFLRFYQPAIGFPLFFVLCGLVWIALMTRSTRRAVAAAIAAGITFAVLVFTYFFLWTAAAAWLFSVIALWLMARRDARRQTVIVLASISIVSVPALIVYFRLLAHRASTVDAAQALVLTHRPDLFRFPELIAVLTLVVLLVGVMRGALLWRDEGVLFIAALAITTIGVFNQQILTGRSLQPFHYEWFIGNYCAGLALILCVWLVSSSRKRVWIANRRLLVVSILALLWAAAEVWLAASLTRPYNDQIDDGRAVAARLRELSFKDGTSAAERNAEAFPVVLAADLKLADRLPTDAPQALLWAPHMLVFPGISEDENRERFFKQLYYLGFDASKMRKELERGDWTFYAGLFPYYRLSPVTRGSASPITADEIRERVQEYLAYSSKFSNGDAARVPLSYLIVDAAQEPGFPNVDRWYERDRGETFGRFVLYKLKLREP
jgi:hypothetical protein